MAKKRGRQPKFRDVACPDARCKFFGKAGSGTVVSNGTYFVGRTRVRKFICRHCGRVFNSRARTPFRWLHTPQHKVLMALKLLVKGLSLRGTSEVLEVKLDTVRNWLRRAAQHSAAVNHILVRDLRLSQVQVDELWTFVKKNTKTPLGGPPQGPAYS
jgi:transposase-like protein